MKIFLVGSGGHFHQENKLMRLIMKSISLPEVGDDCPVKKTFLVAKNSLSAVRLDFAVGMADKDIFVQQ